MHGLKHTLERYISSSGVVVKIAIKAIIYLTALIPLQASFAVEDPASGLAKVGVQAQLGSKLDLSLKFTDERGQTRTLREFFIPQRPIIIAPVYYGCPRLCGLLFNGVTELINKQTLNLGSDYSVLAVSFDPKDKVSNALAHAEKFRGQLTKAGINPEKWHFLIGEQSSIDGVMKSIGFNYEADGADYSHTAAIFFITPNGELSQFLAGISFDPEVVRRSLVEASQGAIGSVIDQVFLFCFRYDHLQGKYVWAAFGIMRLGGLLTLLFLALLIYRLWRKDRSVSGGPPAQ